MFINLSKKITFTFAPRYSLEFISKDPGPCGGRVDVRLTDSLSRQRGKLLVGLSIDGESADEAELVVAHLVKAMMEYGYDEDVKELTLAIRQELFDYCGLIVKRYETKDVQNVPRVNGMVEVLHPIGEEGEMCSLYSVVSPNLIMVETGKGVDFAKRVDVPEGDPYMFNWRLVG